MRVTFAAAARGTVVRDDDPSDEAGALIAGYVEGALTPAQYRRLRELIRREPRLARMLAENLHIEGEIREHFPARSTRQTSRRVRILRLRPADRPSGAWVASASIAAAGVLLFLAFADPHRQRARSAPPPEPEIVQIPSTQPAKVDEPPKIKPRKALHPEESPVLVPRTFDLSKQTEGPGLAVLEKAKETPKPAATVANLPPPIPPAPIVVARVEQAKGAFLMSNGLRTAIAAGCDLQPGQGLTTGDSGRATLVFPDGTRVKLESGTRISEVKSEKGKSLEVEQGAVSAVVAKQDIDKPMIFATPYGTATVVGTSLRIAVVPGASGSSLLQVMEGKVQFTNKAGTVMVEGGHEARATRANLTSRAMKAEGLLEAWGTIKVSFGPENRTLPADCVIDSGKVYDDERGHGWNRAMQGLTSPGEYSDPLEASFIGGGSRQVTRTWWMRVPKGRYLVTVCVGGVGLGVADQGPHMVKVQGQTVVNGEPTNPNRPFIRKEVLVDAEGKLTVVIGGHGTTQRTSDKDDDTLINYLIIQRR